MIILKHHNNKSRIKIFLTALLVATIVSSGCVKKPTACFDASKTIAAINESITFNSSCATNMDNCEWDFGDGTKSTDANPTHTYAVAGNYTIKMMAMSKKDKMDEISKSITIQ
ncbi:MAG: PKD domain-containing protein [Bacteroidetes bacterium]|nr:PKD domain-containing protein [Bacteroidota bacterium]